MSLTKEGGTAASKVLKPVFSDFPPAFSGILTSVTIPKLIPCPAGCGVIDEQLNDNSLSIVYPEMALFDEKMGVSPELFSGGIY